MPVGENSTVRPVFTIAINDTKPIWFYCSQAKHCQSGMVGVINAPAANSSRTLATFKDLAAKAPANLSPGQSGASPASTSTARPSTSLGAGAGAGAGIAFAGVAGSTGSGVAAGTGSASRTTSTGLPQVTVSAGNTLFSNAKDILSTVALVGLVGAYGSWFL